MIHLCIVKNLLSKYTLKCAITLINIQGNQIVRVVVMFRSNAKEELLRSMRKNKIYLCKMKFEDAYLMFK